MERKECTSKCRTCKQCELTEIETGSFRVCPDESLICIKGSPSAEKLGTDLQNALTELEEMRQKRTKALSGDMEAYEHNSDEYRAVSFIADCINESELLVCDSFWDCQRNRRKYYNLVVNIDQLKSILEAIPID